MGMLKEFREFALKGNVLDLAIGVIIGGAFGKIVTSMITDVIMPVVSIPGKADFTNLYIGLESKVRQEVKAAVDAGQPIPSLAQARTYGSVFAYGSFLTEVINFIILAFCVFIVVKMFNSARRRFEAEKVPPPPPPPPGPSNEERLLTEIRDLLKAKA